MANEAPRTDAGKSISGSPLLIALIAFAGVLFGALVTAGATYLAADRQARASHEETVRTQQLTAYSQFLADSEDLERARFDFVRLISTSSTRYNSDAIAAIKRPVDEAFRKVNQDVSVVNLVGSQSAALIAQDIFILDFGRNGYVRGIELVVNTKTEDELYNMFKEELRKSINVDGDRHKLLVEFTDQARLDVSR